MSLTLLHVLRYPFLPLRLLNSRDVRWSASGRWSLRIPVQEPGGCSHVDTQRSTRTLE